MTQESRVERILVEMTTSIDTPMVEWNDIGGIAQYESEVVLMTLTDLIHVLDPFQ